MGSETLSSECPMCEGAIMRQVSDNKSQCPRCGHVEKED